MLSKVIIAFSITLFLFVVFEVGYIFFYKSSNTTSAPSQVKEVVNPQQISGQKQNPNQARNNYWIDIISSSLSVNKYEGIITSIINTPGQSRQVNYQEAIGLKPLNPSGRTDPMRLFLIRQQDLAVLKVYDSTSESKKEIKFSDLKIGDKIRIEEDLDMMKDPSSNRVRLDITKI